MAAGFLTPLRLETIGPRRWVLLAPLVYVSAVGRRLTVPAGCTTDGASVPRPLWWLYPPIGGAYDHAAVLHDFCYAQAEALQLTRAAADALFLEAMAATGFRRTGRWTIYLGVRIGGWAAWQGHRRRQELCS
jgi:hypothetical protein